VDTQPSQPSFIPTSAEYRSALELELP